jgi:hypothetical protein
MQNIKGEDGDVFLNNHVDVVISYHSLLYARREGMIMVVVVLNFVILFH